MTLRQGPGTLRGRETVRKAPPVETCTFEGQPFLLPCRRTSSPGRPDCTTSQGPSVVTGSSVTASLLTTVVPRGPGSATPPSATVQGRRPTSRTVQLAASG